MTPGLRAPAERPSSRVILRGARLFRSPVSHQLVVVPPLWLPASGAVDWFRFRPQSLHHAELAELDRLGMVGSPDQDVHCGHPDIWKHTLAIKALKDAYNRGAIIVGLLLKIFRRKSPT